MFLLRKPDDETVIRIIESCRDEHFSYTEVGVSRDGAPDNYNVDHNRILIGSGEKDFQKAVEAVRRWKMFDLPWVALCPPVTPIAVGSTVAAVISHLGFWSVNVSRIVYVIEEHGETEKFGFAYGTLASHAESGEERFLVEFDRNSGEVHYDLFAFSRPRHPLAVLGYPLARWFQKEFAKASKESMRRAVAG